MSRVLHAGPQRRSSCLAKHTMNPIGLQTHTPLTINTTLTYFLV